MEDAISGHQWQSDGHQWSSAPLSPVGSLGSLGAIGVEEHSPRHTHQASSTLRPGGAGARSQRGASTYLMRHAINMHSGSRREIAARSVDLPAIRSHQRPSSRNQSSSSRNQRSSSRNRTHPRPNAPRSPRGPQLRSRLSAVALSADPVGNMTRDVISGSQRSSEVITSTRSTREVIRANQISSVAIRGHQWQSEVIRGNWASPVGNTPPVESSPAAARRSRATWRPVRRSSSSAPHSQRAPPRSTRR